MNAKSDSNRIPGYSYESHDIERSPLSLEDLKLLKESVMFTEEDEKYLRMAGEVVSDQIENILDVWYGFVASHPHLVYYFGGADGKPDSNYLAAVRRRFGQWILDTCNRNYDTEWLNYQAEIGIRHHRSKKNKTDNVQSVPNISFRYIVAFIYPITATFRPFLEKKGHRAADVDRMYQAWFKSVVLQVALWSYPFVKPGDF